MIADLTDYHVRTTVHMPEDRLVLDRASRSLIVHPLTLIDAVTEKAPAERVAQRIDWHLRRAVAALDRLEASL